MSKHLDISQAEWSLLRQLVTDHLGARLETLRSTNSSDREWQEFSDIERLATTIDFIIIQNETRRI